MRQHRLFAVLLMTALIAATSRAEAAMVFCNRTQSPIEAAFGYREKVDWISEGWWRIEPGQCARVFGRPLTQRFYFYYATSLAPHTRDKPPLDWSGKYQLCTDTKAFHIEGDEDCELRSYEKKNFQEVDIGASTRDYTLDFKESGDSH